MKKNNFGMYSMNFMRKPKNFFNNSENDSSLQNRINRSLYPLNKRAQPFQQNTIHNISDYEYNNNSNNYDLIEDFKATLMKTQQLTNELMQNKNSNLLYKQYNNYNNNNYNFNFESKISSEENDSDKNYNTEDLEEDEEEEEESDEENSSKNKDEIDSNINNLNNKYKIINNKKENDLQKKQNEEKLKSSNQNLKNLNQKLRNENRILEVEITNYQSNNNEKKKNILTNFDENLFSFITSLKKSLKSTTKKNTEIVDLIFDNQKNLEEIDKKNKKLIEEQKKLSEEIEKNNRKKAEIQIMRRRKNFTK